MKADKAAGEAGDGGGGGSPTAAGTVEGRAAIWGPVEFLPTPAQPKLNPGREIGQFAPVGVLDHVEHRRRLVPGDPEPMADEGARRAAGSAGVGADQVDADRQQGLPVRPSQFRRLAARLPGIAGRAVRLGTGVG
ncbi:hypothetical protein, partial [Methylorubrum suomiense]|uniref:hypothetical protein n=1 Tax=Methylorubrum suomiense TaxID=144191 RepID=UPI001EE21F88